MICSRCREPGTVFMMIGNEEKVLCIGCWKLAGKILETADATAKAFTDIEREATVGQGCGKAKARGK